MKLICSFQIFEWKKKIASLISVNHDTANQYSLTCLKGYLHITNRGYELKGSLIFPINE